MAIQRLDLKTARYDRLARSVLFNARGGCTVEVSLEALEAQYQRVLDPDEAVTGAVALEKRLSALATMLPPDDGRITITTSVLMGEGLYGEGLARPEEPNEDEKEG
ncbi:MAG: hypothetical protein LJE67_04640 [Salaquimonas sp.]|jgi:hypothetical protein|nr:hypothetical protein [Salaquimonas sp.]